MKTECKSVLKTLSASAVRTTGPDMASSKAEVLEPAPEMEKGNVAKPDGILFSRYPKFNNPVFNTDNGAHFKGNITEQTKHLVDKIEKELIASGSPMQKVLQVSFLLHGHDYEAMNETYKGRLGDKPPVRTTVAAHGSVPGNSCVEKNWIAYI